ELQGIAQKIVTDKMVEQGATYKAGEAAAVILDRRGAVKAVVGGHDYRKSQFNRVVKSRRQPGSTFKPFVFLTALENGLTPDSIVHDGDITIGDWSPRNYNDRFHGDVTLRKGLARSLNSVAVRLAEWAGRDRVIKTAHRLGINSTLRNNPSIALGTSEVSLLEITTAYVPFANDGLSVLPHVMKRIRDQDGQTLFQRGSPYWGRAISPRHVAAMNDMLSATIKFGTARQAALDPHPAAGKTGTGQDYRDAWFIGYTGHYVTGVWVGNDDFKPMKRVTGGSLPTKIWRDLMVAAHADKTPEPLPGRDWQQVGRLEGGARRSFWDSLFGGGDSGRDGGAGDSDRILRSPGGSSTSGRTKSKSWTKDVFQSN
ncbi:MAG: transglycosylase domain-containing protein, partial [Methyloligellaceae bacterium]